MKVAAGLGVVVRRSGGQAPLGRGAGGGKAGEHGGMHLEGELQARWRHGSGANNLTRRLLDWRPWKVNGV